jgi:hypothetical protein
MPNFVVLEHHWNGVHWDLMLEAGTILRTWALETEPSFSRSAVAKQSADHRPIYLNYEGEISGGRGHVSRWDGGTFEWLHDSEDEVQVKLFGQRLNGRATLKLTAPAVWSFRLHGTECGVVD